MFVFHPSKVLHRYRKKGDGSLKPKGNRNVWFAIAFHNDVCMYHKAVEMHRRFVDDWKAQQQLFSPGNGDDFICHGIFQALPTIFSRHSVERGGNVLGLDREINNKNAVMFQVQLAFRSGGTEAERAARERVAGFRTALKELQRRAGRGGRLGVPELRRLHAGPARDLRRGQRRLPARRRGRVRPGGGVPDAHAGRLQDF